MGSAVAGAFPHLRNAAEAERRRNPRGTRLREITTMSSDKKNANLKLALILASVALVFFVGIIAKMLLLGRP